MRKSGISKQFIPALYYAITRFPIAVGVIRWCQATPLSSTQEKTNEQLTSSGF